MVSRRRILAPAPYGKWGVGPAFRLGTYLSTTVRWASSPRWGETEGPPRTPEGPIPASSPDPGASRTRRSWSDSAPLDRCAPRCERVNGRCAGSVRSAEFCPNPQCSPRITRPPRRSVHLPLLRPRALPLHQDEAPEGVAGLTRFLAGSWGGKITSWQFRRSRVARHVAFSARATDRTRSASRLCGGKCRSSTAASIR